MMFVFIFGVYNRISWVKRNNISSISTHGRTPCTVMLQGPITLTQMPAREKTAILLGSMYRYCPSFGGWVSVDMYLFLTPFSSEAMHAAPL